MYKDVLNAAPYQIYATAVGSLKEGGTSTANVVFEDVGMYDKLFLRIGYNTAYPNYDSRGPSLEIQLVAPVDHPTSTYTGAPGAQIGYYSIDVGATPDTPANYIIDIGDSALGRIGVNHWLAEGAVGATARAAYSIQLVGRGWNKSW